MEKTILRNKTIIKLSTVLWIFDIKGARDWAWR